MSRYKAYPECRDWGVEWLGEVPVHWKVLPLKYLAEFSGGGTPSKENLDFWNGDIPWVSPKDMKTHRIRSAIDSITDSAIRQSSTKLLEKGALLMVVRSGILQHSIPVAINEVPVALNQDMKALRFSSPLLGEYAFYFVTGIQSNLLLEWSKEGATVESIEHEYLANTYFSCPPLEDRTAIIHFLDNETAKIDALTEKQQRLIELLKEKRQAVISHAVTKGLNPNAPMKDSRVEWLGEVPAHWGVTQLKYATSMIVDCPHETPVYSEGSQYLVIRTADLDEGRLDPSKMYRVDRDEYILRIRRAALSQGDIVYGREGERWGHAGLVPEDHRYCLGQRMMQFRANSLFCSDFLMWLLNSDNVYKQGQVDTVGATSPHVNVGTIRNFLLTQPSFSEQQEISRFLNDETCRLDALVSKTRNTVLLLQERRSALISAAVTGRIDVRDWQPVAA